MLCGLNLNFKGNWKTHQSEPRKIMNRWKLIRSKGDVSNKTAWIKCTGNEDDSERILMG